MNRISEAVYAARLLVLIACVFSSGNAMAHDISSGLDGRVVVGYQGWFGCPGDFEDNESWQHWFSKDVRPDHLTVDLLPSVRDINPEDLCDTRLPRADGNGVIKLFSSQNQNVVNQHFKWMRQHGIDAAAVQRFISEVAFPEKRRRSDHVIENVLAAARANGRTFYVVYDITGSNPKTVIKDIRDDWRYLSSTLKIIDESAYLHDHSKPVIGIWGFGLGDRPGDPGDVNALIRDLKQGSNGLAAATVVGGVPTHWRTLTDDSKSDPRWANVYRSYDVISPWIVGRIRDETSADEFSRKIISPDVVEARKSGVRYMPVVFPGFSWHNLMKNGRVPVWRDVNQIPRGCGRFLWHQIANVLNLHVDSIYVAMFDEVDEGTAIFPTETRQDKLPEGSTMLYLNEDGCSLPDDWYLKVVAAASSKLKTRTPVSVNLDDIVRP